MSNISTAKSSLHAELAHVQSGLAYYQARVEALNAALHQLDEIGDEIDAELDMEEAKPARKARAGRRGRRAAVAQKAEKPARRSRGASRLPTTGGDFFPDLIGEQKQTMTELLQAAAAQIPFKTNAEEQKQLRSRLVAAVNHMLQAGKIRDEGKGRQRVYFRA